MSGEPEHQEFLPDLDVGGALRAAFRAREPSSRDVEGARPPASVAAHAGRTDYELQGEIARGGMGVVVKAFDRELTRDVALKVMRDELVHEPRLVQRFLEEARITARLDHPGIVPVHEAGRDAAGRPYYAMRLVRGRDLSRIMELANANAEGWSRTRALSVFLRVCEAMAYAHDKGILHRDLKPPNVMVGEFGEVYVMDWGVARVLGHADAHDLRLRDPPRPSEARALDDAALADGESALVTMDGEVLGTPSYMSPEQALGRLSELGTRSDVYSVGAMLYHLLAGEMPYVSAGTRVASRIVLLLVVGGPPRALHTFDRDLPAELIAICERAMARDPRERYPGMLEMAEDLRAFLERRVVHAYETGAWAEARKWVRRNKGFAAASAAAVLALASGLVASLVLRARALESEGVATQRADDVLRLSALQDLEDLSAETDQLWPADPEMIPRFERWLERAGDLLEELPGHEAKLAELRARSVPSSAEEEALGRANHPLSGELEAVERELGYWRRLAAASQSPEGATDPSAEEAGVDVALLPGTAAALERLARPLIDRRRSEHGGEARGLVLARRALALAAELPPPERASIRDTLAWALLANGRYDEAALEGDRAREEAGPERAQEFQEKLDELLASIDEAIRPENLEREEQRVVELEARAAELAAEITPRPEWTFADTQDRWWHNQLQKLVDSLKALSDPASGVTSAGISPEHGWGVRKRLEFARSLREGLAGGAHERAWADALPAIEAAVPGLALRTQAGLLPIGPDPDTGLFEFAHLASGEPAVRGADGRIVLEDATGLVLVLLPGGEFRMGAQASDPAQPNYDPQSEGDERPVHAVTLSPFFLSKYELTQGQWSRLTAVNPSVFGPQRYHSDFNRAHRPWCSRHPVEFVSWTDCSRTLWRAGLGLPTEAQWEYGCRAGTSSVFWSGDDPESLLGVANLSDSFAQANGSETLKVWESWLDDGEVLHAEVGTFRANAFGLHDMHGNVWEWCRDRHASYRFEVGAGDGERQGRSPDRVYRGGAFGTGAIHARSSFRYLAGPEYSNDNVGVRPARRIAY